MLCIVVTHGLIYVAYLIGAVIETVPVLVLRLAPLHFAKGCQTWKKHIVQVVRSRNVFCPEVCLYSDDMCSFLCSHFRCAWLERVALFHRQESSDGERLALLVERLVEVQIVECVRSHDGIVTELGCLQPAVHSSP